jgi:hypothetical protein
MIVYEKKKEVFLKFLKQDHSREKRKAPCFQGAWGEGY